MIGFFYVLNLSLIVSILNWFTSDSALWVLFSSGFLSATLLPGASEVTLMATLQLNSFPIWLVVLIATLGNTLGGVTNYWLGLLFPNKTLSYKSSPRSVNWIKKYGYWALLFSWLPIIGDPLCLAAGWLRMNFWFCALLICIGKASRYCLLSLAFNGIL